MSLSFSAQIALDFLKHLPKTKELSKYSPKAPALAAAAKLTYVDESGGRYALKAEHIMDAARAARIKVGKDGRIAVSADAFHKRQANVVHDSSHICRHGPTPYTLLETMSGDAFKRYICPHCLNGHESPTAAELAEAEAYFATTATGTPPALGALMVVGQRLGYTVTASTNGTKRLMRTPVKNRK